MLDESAVNQRQKTTITKNSQKKGGVIYKREPTLPYFQPSYRLTGEPIPEMKKKELALAYNGLDYGIWFSSEMNSLYVYRVVEIIDSKRENVATCSTITYTSHSHKHTNNKIGKTFVIHPHS